MPVLASRSGVSASRSIRNAATVAPLHMRGGPSLSQCQPIAMTCARKLADPTPVRDMTPVAAALATIAEIRGLRLAARRALPILHHKPTRVDSRAATPGGGTPAHS